MCKPPPRAYSEGVDVPDLPSISFLFVLRRRRLAGRNRGVESGWRQRGWRKNYLGESEGDGENTCPPVRAGNTNVFIAAQQVGPPQ